MLLSIQVAAQYRLSGKVTSSLTGHAVSDCAILLNQKYRVSTNSLGEFEFSNVKPGTYSLHCACPDFKSFRKSIEVTQDLQLNIDLTPRKEDLSEVVVTGGQKSFGNNRMRAVEGLGIYEGKKTEVIQLDQLTANLATNNARQIYARVPGLNIWENDGSGLQLNIGARGLDPNRTSSFNVRQNGYDISADALGYPESYYTPPTEVLERIELVRGAASLQYGPQFGGLLNFVMKKPVDDKKIQLTARQTYGSFNFYNSSTTASGTIGKLSYLTFFQYKKGDGWRPNSAFKSCAGFANLNYRFNENSQLTFDYTKMYYLARQAGGLSDKMFEENPRQSNRGRNWFRVNWNLFALQFDHKFNSQHEVNLRVFGIQATRDALGFRDNRIETIDDNQPRDLIRGEFKNWGTEARYLHRYTLAEKQAVLLLGTRYYHGFNHSRQGVGTRENDANFNYANPDTAITYDFRFPNRNVAFFAENIFHLSQKFSVTPGARLEYISTTSSGDFANFNRDLAGNILSYNRFSENRKNTRHFIMSGVGFSYKPNNKFDLYANISGNFRSVTFDDMRISNLVATVDSNLTDERGFSADLGIRSNQTELVSFDISLFAMKYGNRIGEVQVVESNRDIRRKRTNVGQAFISGLECFGEFDVLHTFLPDKEKTQGAIFTNVALINSRYTESLYNGVKGNKVEFVPNINLKTGVKTGYKGFKASFQYTYVSYQYTDATNALKGGSSAVTGLIPGYAVMDASISYQWKYLKLESSVNNLGNRMYFSRRATGYPGPGILPADGRSFYVSLQLQL